MSCDFIQLNYSIRFSSLRFRNPVLADWEKCINKLVAKLTQIRVLLENLIHFLTGESEKSLCDGILVKRTNVERFQMMNLPS